MSGMFPKAGAFSNRSQKRKQVSCAFHILYNLYSFFRRPDLMQLTHPPLSLTVLHTLHSLDIRTLADLHAHGSVKTFLLLKAAGLTITRSTLWQLEAMIRGISAQKLQPSEKAALLEKLKQHPPVNVFPPLTEMERFMREALVQAEQSALLGEIPVGAVVVHQNRIIAAAHNTCITGCNISQHAEINALAAAGKALNNYRLDGCDVYITLEPCNMCASALIQARVQRVIYGAKEPKTGAAGSVTDLFSDIRLNRHTSIKGGILADECSDMLKRFFSNRR